MRPRQKYVTRLSALIFIFVVQVATSVSYGMKDPSATLTSKQQMQTHQVGDTVVICRADGTKLRAKIVSEGESSAVLRNAEGKSVEISYSDVASVRNGGLSRKATIWIVVGVAFVALAIFGTRV